jgi:hypothetical protein
VNRPVVAHAIFDALAHGNPMSRLDLANTTGFARGNVSHVVDRLCDLGQLDIVPRPVQVRNYRPLVKINDAGRAARKLPTPVRMPPRREPVKAAKPAKAVAKVASPEPKTKRVRDVKPEPAPRPIVRIPDAEPLPPPELPALSPAVATFRGLVHPLPPLAHAKPKGLDGVNWGRVTTLPSMQRRA